MALVADGQAIGSLGDAAGMAGRWGAQRRLIQRLGWRVFDQIRVEFQLP